MWTSVAIAGLIGTAPVCAQQKDRSIFFGGVNPRDIVYKPIDVSQSIVPVQQPAEQDKFSFRHLFSKVIPGLSPAPGMNLLPIPPAFSGAPLSNLTPGPTPLPVKK
jgi:hypothetical protein